MHKDQIIQFNIEEALLKAYLEKSQRLKEDLYAKEKQELEC